MLTERLFPPDRPPSLAAVSLLGVVCGVLSGLAIVALHQLIDLARLGTQQLSDHEARHWMPAALALAGAVLLGLVEEANGR